MCEWKIINGKCEEVLPTLKDNIIDLVITSPPYNVNLGDNKFNKNPYDLYNDNKEHRNYLNWLENIFKIIHTKLKVGGRCVINIGDGKNGAIPTHSDIIQLMTNKIGYLPITTIVWDKKSISNRTSWGSFASPSQPSFPKPFEYILIFAKENKKLQYQGETDLTNDEFIKWSYALWQFTPETQLKKLKHPAPFPVELPYRLIKMLSWKNAIILDPFNGIGTTGVACQQLNRNYIGIELSKQYCEISEKRIKTMKEEDIFQPKIEKKTKKENIQDIFKNDK